MLNWYFGGTVKQNKDIEVEKHSDQLISPHSVTYIYEYVQVGAADVPASPFLSRGCRS